VGSWYDRDEIGAAIDRLTPRLREVRHDIHKHPELGFEEHRTHKLVCDWLQRHGYEPRTAAETGVFADLRPDLVGGGKTTIGLRADLDCLPMDETTDLPYRSVHAGRAHKCGHDGHTTVLLGVAAVLARHREAMAGNVRLIFQPAEEGVRGGGAKVMVAEGVLDGVDEVYALHNWPAYPRGEVRVRPGPLMAQTHELDILVTGVGGHGSQPQLCRDPIVAASHLVTALQSVVARGLGYEGGAVLSICRFHAGSADNIIPVQARLGGTIRTFAPEVTERVLQRLREIVRGTADTFGVKIELQARPGYPVLVNDEACVEAVVRVAERVVGAERVSGDGLPMAGGEDFAYMARATRGAYFFVGSGDEGRENPVCHHPDFDFDDRIIPTAMAMMLGLVDDRLG
jgi:amidohydrolase